MYAFLCVLEFRNLDYKYTTVEDVVFTRYLIAGMLLLPSSLSNKSCTQFLVYIYVNKTCTKQRERGKFVQAQNNCVYYLV